VALEAVEMADWAGKGWAAQVAAGSVEEAELEEMEEEMEGGGEKDLGVAEREE